MFNTNIYNYRVRIINHETGEICEQYYDDIDYARTCYRGVIIALGIVWNSDCEYYIEHHIGDDEWERVPDEDEDEDFTEDDNECMDYLSEDGTAPCDGIGYCIGSACPYYGSCTE